MEVLYLLHLISNPIVLIINLSFTKGTGYKNSCRSNEKFHSVKDTMREVEK